MGLSHIVIFIFCLAIFVKIYDRMGAYSESFKIDDNLLDSSKIDNYFLDSPFVAQAMQILTAMLALSEKAEACYGIYCYYEGRIMRVKMEARESSWAYAVTHPYDTISSLHHTSTYLDFQYEQFDRCLEQATEKYPEIGGKECSSRSILECRLAPDDKYVEWVLFESSIAVPSSSHYAALKSVVKQRYPHSDIHI